MRKRFLCLLLTLLLCLSLAPVSQAAGGSAYDRPGQKLAALTSQFISNVPAAILLSRFTQDYQGLLIGVNVGGAGTLIASLASLITFREFAKHKPAQTGRFLLLFLAVSFGFLAVLLGAMSLLGQA